MHIHTAVMSLQTEFTFHNCVPTQEELLLSILPKHIADEMLQSMKDQAQQQDVQQQQQFNTMYMYRHENVRSEALFYHRDLIYISRWVSGK